MYGVVKIDGKLCHVFKHHLDLLDEDCDDIYSTRNFRLRTRWRTLAKLFDSKSLCQAHWFPLIYWMILSMSVLGSIYSFRELFTSYTARSKRISMWRGRKFYVLPYKLLRKCRLIGAFVMLNAWLLLWYAVVTVSPVHMTPWLTINMFVLAFEWITWIAELFAGTSRIEMHTLLSFALPTLNLLFVQCVRNVFVSAVDMDDVNDLRLWHTNK